MQHVLATLLPETVLFQATELPAHQSNQKVAFNKAEYWMLGLIYDCTLFADFASSKIISPCA